MSNTQERQNRQDVDGTIGRGHPGVSTPPGYRAVQVRGEGSMGREDPYGMRPLQQKGFQTPPGYIPYTYDGFVQMAIIGFWIVVGILSVMEGRRCLLPKSRLKRRILIVSCCALASIFLYAFYILKRQAVESAAAIGESMQSRGR